jgi:capsular polysaccharide biosynthesis protein
MRHRRVISPAEAGPVGIPEFMRNLRMAILIAVLHIGLAVVLKILARSLDSIVKSAPLDFVQLLGRGLPVAVPVICRRS